LLAESDHAKPSSSINWGALFNVGLSAVGLVGSTGCAASAAGLEVSTLGAASPVALPTLAVCSAGVVLSLNELDAGMRSLWSGIDKPSYLATGLSQWAGLTVPDAELAVSFANLATGLGVFAGVRSTGTSLINAEKNMIWEQVGKWDDEMWKHSFKVTGKPGSLLWDATNQPIRAGSQYIFDINRTVMELHNVVKP
jgi:hypothetical protein